MTRRGVGMQRIGIAISGGPNPAEIVECVKLAEALGYIPAERLVVTTDSGFGREGLSRRIAYYKCVALVEGTNIVRRELGLPEAPVRAADPRLWFASGPESA